MNNIIIRLIALPVHIRAFTVPDSQGDYNVYINENLSAEQQKKSFMHEQRHIENEDFIKELPATVIEKLH